MTSFITTVQLQKAFGITRSANLKKALTDNKVRYFTDRDGKPFTTVKAMNVALGVENSDKAFDDGFSIDHLKVHA